MQLVGRTAQQLRVGRRARSRQRQGLGGPQHPGAAQAAVCLGGELPGVAAGAQRHAGGVALGGGGAAAGVAHVGAAHLHTARLVEIGGHRLVQQAGGVLRGGASGEHLGVVQVGDALLGRGGRAELLGQLPVGVGEVRRAQLCQTVGQQIAQHLVGTVVATGVDHRPLHLRLGHQRRALRHLVHPLEQLQHLVHMRRADVVVQRRAVGHHVGRFAARVPVGVVQPGVGDHVLPQIVAAHVHQFGGVQRAAPGKGSGRGVGGAPGKAVFHPHHRQRAGADHRVHRVRMPGEHRVQPAEQPRARHVCLARAVLLGRAAEKPHLRPHKARRHQLLQDHRRAERARAQQVVAAAVPRRALCQRRLLRAGRLLGQPVQRIVFAQKADHRPLAAVPRLQRGGQPGGGAGHRKAFRLQRACGGIGAFGLPPVQLGCLPHLVGQAAHRALLFGGNAPDLLDQLHTKLPFSPLCGLFSTAIIPPPGPARKTERPFLLAFCLYKR